MRHGESERATRGRTRSTSTRLLTTMNVHQGLLGTEPKLRSALFVSALALCVSAVAPSCGGGGGGGGTTVVVPSVQVQSVQPATGPFIGGTPLEIRGERFAQDEVNEVTIGGRPCTEVVVVSETLITCKAPAGTPGAEVDVRVENSLGAGVLADGYRYLAPPPATSDLNGDGIADLIVAAPLADVGLSNNGAVYVFYGSDLPLGVQSANGTNADLVLRGAGVGDGFGACVCAGDVNGDGADDLVVGANLVDGPGAADAGACYVFYGPLASATPISANAASVRIAGSTAVAGDRFGSTVGIADVDGNGTSDVLVGAPGHDIGALADAGCVYVFAGGTSLASGTVAAASMHFDGDGVNDQLGSRILSGDLDDDGVRDLVICAPLADPMLPPVSLNAGKVFVLRGGAGLASGAVGASAIVLTGVAPQDRFGESAAVADVDGDGIDDLVVGAPRNDAFGTDTGRVYVFRGGAHLGSGTADDADVILSGMPTHNAFGESLRTADVDGDSIADVLVGAPDADYLNDRNGRVYVFRGGASLVDAVAIQAHAMFNGESNAGDRFGRSVTLLDMNADGFADVCGSSSQNNGGTGRAYLWLGGNGTLAGQHQASAAHAIYSGVEIGALFGASLAEGQ